MIIVISTIVVNITTLSATIITIKIFIRVAITRFALWSQPLGISWSSSALLLIDRLKSLYCVLMLKHSLNCKVLEILFTDFVV